MIQPVCLITGVVEVIGAAIYRRPAIFCQPVDLAEEVFHVVAQGHSAWSFDIEIRPFGEHW